MIWCVLIVLLGSTEPAIVHLIGVPCPGSFNEHTADVYYSSDTRNAALQCMLYNQTELNLFTCEIVILPDYVVIIFHIVFMWLFILAEVLYG